MYGALDNDYSCFMVLGLIACGLYWGVKLIAPSWRSVKVTVVDVIVDGPNKKLISAQTKEIQRLTRMQHMVDAALRKKDATNSGATRHVRNLFYVSLAVRT